ncbi:MAG: hypothetical protein ABJ246_06490 [Paracoccaceae bacterium]
MKISICAFLLGSVQIFLGSSALATTLSFTFSGDVSSAGVASDASVSPGGLSAGASVAGRVTYSVSDFSLQPGLDLSANRYSGSGKVEINLGNRDYTADLTDIVVRDGSPINTSDSMQFRFSNVTPTVDVPGFTNIGLPGGSVIIQSFASADTGLVANNQLPTSISELNLTSANGSGVVGNFVLNNDNPSQITAYNINFDLQGLGLQSSQPTLDELTTSNLESSATPPATSQFNFGGDLGPRFNSQAPTVVITHGRQVGGNSTFFADRYTGDPFEVEDLSAAYDAIKAKDAITGVETNVILLTWESAFVRKEFRDLPGLISPVADSYDVGSEAAEQLSQLIPGGYTGEIHIIGHSYGTAVNNSLAPKLLQNGYSVDRYTVLDAPFNVPSNLKVLNEQAYSIIGSQFSDFENYYATEGKRTDPALGAPIDGARLDGGYAVPTTHSGVFDEYIASINDKSFLLSAEGGGFNSAPASITPPSFSVVVPDFVLPTATHLQNSNYNDASGSGLLQKGSDAFIVWRNQDFLAFDLLSMTIDELILGELDWFEILLGGQTIAFFDGDSKISDFDLFLPIVPNSVNSSDLVFLLSGRGDGEASLAFSNLQLVNFDQPQIAAVPLPGSALFLILSMVILSRLSRRA